MIGNTSESSSCFYDILFAYVLCFVILLYSGYLVPSSVHKRRSLSPLSLSFFLFSLGFPSRDNYLFSLAIPLVILQIYTTLISDFLVPFHRVNAPL